MRTRDVNTALSSLATPQSQSRARSARASRMDPNDMNARAACSSLEPHERAAPYAPRLSSRQTHALTSPPPHELTSLDICNPMRSQSRRRMTSWAQVSSCSTPVRPQQAWITTSCPHDASTLRHERGNTERVFVRAKRARQASCPQQPQSPKLKTLQAAALEPPRHNRARLRARSIPLPRGLTAAPDPTCTRASALAHKSTSLQAHARIRA